ncbi:MAG: malto-oligosyltrehalose synthase [Actinomycetia bacterium]|nr:malto-oligosyltrehalose synthase [Actinomycetes bacterium]
MPVSTYRLQIHAGFTYADAARQVPYLATLGVTHVYLSPILQPTPGSTHGYDVLDHTRIHAEAGGRAGFDELVLTCREHQLGIIVDVVPNHMTVPKPTHLNAPLWSLLREGRDSPFASWFDVDWDVEDDRILMPVLGGSLAAAIESGDIVLTSGGGPTGREWVIWHHGDEFPVRPGTEELPLPELLERQAYRLSSWREAAEGLNYRRFFDVTSLVAVRVEDPVVFAATHAMLLALFGHGAIDGFRIDHPDGLADPGGYLEALAAGTGSGWVVVEKILEGEEELPQRWECAGTTGYDALMRVQQVLTDPAGEAALDRLWEDWSAGTPHGAPMEQIITESKQLVVLDVQAAEVDRLMRLVARIVPDEDHAALRRALEAMLVAMDRYRAYIVPGKAGDGVAGAVIEGVVERARLLLDVADRDALATMAVLVTGGWLPQAHPGRQDTWDEFRIRFQQTCGPVMAKGIEDTAFYRWFRLAGANEVGGHPQTLSIEPAQFHDFAARQLAEWPLTMTTLTTHDTKRSEDVRARLMVLAAQPEAWGEWLAQAERLAAPYRSERLDRPTEYLIWQTLVGTWPITAARLEEYLLKAVREAKVHTAWVDGDLEYEAAVVDFATGVLRDADLRAHLDEWISGQQSAIRAAILGQRLIQLLMPGVPDVYQGCELITLSLVDPDNRRPVNYDARAERLARLDEGEPPVDMADEKLLVVSRALRLRRDHPSWFVGENSTYAPLACPDHVLGFTRGDEHGPAVAVVASLVTAAPMEPQGRIELPPGAWRDELSGEAYDIETGGITVGELLSDRAVALLVRES